MDGSREKGVVVKPGLTMANKKGNSLQKEDGFDRMKECQRTVSQSV